jgi:hypothetical protein
MDRELWRGQNVNESTYHLFLKRSFEITDESHVKLWITSLPADKCNGVFVEHKASVNNYAGPIGIALEDTIHVIVL